MPDLPSPEDYENAYYVAKADAKYWENQALDYMEKLNHAIQLLKECLAFVRHSEADQFVRETMKCQSTTTPATTAGS